MAIRNRWKNKNQKPRKSLFHSPTLHQRGMNSTTAQYTSEDKFTDAFAKNFTAVLIGLIVNTINGLLVFIFFKSAIFYNDSRYILYIHMVINDMLMVFFSVGLSVMAYAWPKVPVPFCVLLLMISSVTHKNTPLTLAGMALERYIAICKPLHHSQICTVRRTYILISLIWGVGVLPSLADFIVFLIFRPLSYFTSALCSTSNLYNTPYHEEQSKITHGIYTAAVWLILVFTYCRVFLAARKASTDEASAKKAQSTILLHGVQLLLSMLSNITPVIDKIYSNLLPMLRSKITFINYLLTNLLPRLLSPLIYGLRDNQFLEHLKALFSCQFLHVKVKPAKDICRS